MLRRRSLALGLLFAGAASASAEEAVSFPGGPLTVSIGPLGQCQSSYASRGNNFFPPFGSLGDCGFFLAFPAAGTGQPAALKGKTFGFEGVAGPHLPTDTEGGEAYTAVSQSPVTGAGTASAPTRRRPSFTVKSGATTYATVTETTTYVNGEPQFVSTFNVKNETAGRIYFRRRSSRATCICSATISAPVCSLAGRHGSSAESTPKRARSAASRKSMQRFRGADPGGLLERNRN